MHAFSQLTIVTFGLKTSSLYIVSSVTNIKVTYYTFLISHINLLQYYIYLRHPPYNIWYSVTQVPNDFLCYAGHIGIRYINRRLDQDHAGQVLHSNFHCNTTTR